MIRVYADPKALSLAAAELFVADARQALLLQPCRGKVIHDFK
jgi:hypothetical protein